MKTDQFQRIAKAKARQAILTQTLTLLGATKVEVEFTETGINRSPILYKGRRFLTLEDIITAPDYSVHGADVQITVSVVHPLAGEKGQRLVLNKVIPWQCLSGYLDTDRIWQEILHFYLQAIQEKAKETATIRAADLL